MILKRSNQLILESAVIAGLIVGVALGGTASTLSLPSSWLSIQNPSNLLTQYDLSKFALFYNSTLNLLGNFQFVEVSNSLNQTEYLNYPSNLDSSVAEGNSQLGQTNVSIPAALTELNNASNFIKKGQLQNASSILKLGCADAVSANSSFSQFQGATTAQFSNLGVPVLLYSQSVKLVDSVITSLQSQCRSLASKLNQLSNTSGSAVVNFTIGSGEKSLVTGGYVRIFGALMFNGKGLPNDLVIFYLNGTKFSNVTTNYSGDFSINVTTPLVYEPVASIWAVANQSSNIGAFGGAISNTLYFQVIFNETHIAIGDPPSVLPTFSYIVQGNLTTANGTPLSDAPIKITSFGVDYFLNTSSDGTFETTLKVPSNATNGIDFIYAAFAPQGVYGPSMNFTSIVVTHEPMTIDLDSTSQAYSGFNTAISGEVIANNSGIANAIIIVSTPWGNLQSKSDGLGRFSLDTNVPIWEIGSSKVIRVTGASAQSFIAPGNSSTTLGIFNPFVIVVPALVLGVFGYEVRSLGLLSRKKSDEDESNRGEVIQNTSITGEVAPELRKENLSKIVHIYKRAIELSLKKFNLNITQSSTIREILSQVSSVSGSEFDGIKEFGSISMIFEDYLYSNAFDPAKISTAEENLASLERVWRI
jgi:hypothetical protein